MIRTVSVSNITIQSSSLTNTLNAFQEKPMVIMNDRMMSITKKCKKRSKRHQNPTEDFSNKMWYFRLTSDYSTQMTESALQDWFASKKIFFWLSIISFFGSGRIQKFSQLKLY